MICHPPERDLIVAGATRLVTPGEYRTEHNTGPTLDDWQPVAPQRWVDATGPCPTCSGSGLTWKSTASARRGRVNEDHEPCMAAFRCPDCRDDGSGNSVGDGRKREALQVVLTEPPRRCGGNGYLDIYDPCPGCGDCHPCPECKGGGYRTWPGTGRMRPGGMTITHSVCERCNGSGVAPVTFAYATVEVLPVVKFIQQAPLPVLMGWHWVSNTVYYAPRFKESGEQEWWRHDEAGATRVDVQFDPLPVPGRDWVVLLDNVEVVQ